MCEACMQVCHAGHRITGGRLSQSCFCDCGARLPVQDMHPPRLCIVENPAWCLDDLPPLLNAHKTRKVQRGVNYPVIHVDSGGSSFGALLWGHSREDVVRVSSR